MSQCSITADTKENIVEKFLDSSKLDLTDIYCAALLLGNDEKVSNKTKKILMIILTRFMMII